MFYHSLTDNFAIVLVLLLNTYDSPSDSRRGCCPVWDIFDGDAVQPILINLIPVEAALFNTHQTNDRTQHHDQMNLVIPDHLPEVGKWVTRAVRRLLLWHHLRRHQASLLTTRGKTCWVNFTFRSNLVNRFCVVVVDAGRLCLQAGWAARNVRATLLLSHLDHWVYVAGIEVCLQTRITPMDVDHIINHLLRLLPWMTSFGRAVPSAISRHR